MILSIVQFRGSNQDRLLWREISDWAKSLIHITSASSHIDHDGNVKFTVDSLACKKSVDTLNHDLREFFHSEGFRETV